MGEPTIKELLSHLIRMREREVEVTKQRDKTFDAILACLLRQEKAANARGEQLETWKIQNPHTAASCKRAADALSKAVNENMDRMAEELIDKGEDLENQFTLDDIADRFGPRVQHLNVLLQVLGQLSSHTSGRASHA